MHARSLSTMTFGPLLRDASATITLCRTIYEVMAGQNRKYTIIICILARYDIFITSLYTCNNNNNDNTMRFISL